MTVRAILPLLWSAVAGPRPLACVWGRRTECVPGAEQGELREGEQESQREEMVLADGGDQQSGDTTFYFCLSLEK